jgi:hypothetical protein
MANWDFIKKVEEEVPIANVISQYIDLHPVGQGYVGLCPFHDDHHESFAVYPSSNRFICFAASCGVKGSVVDFVSMYEGITKEEAAIRLAKQYGIPVPSDMAVYSPPMWISDLYAESLLEAPPEISNNLIGIITPELIRRFKLYEDEYFTKFGNTEFYAIPECSTEDCYPVNNVIVFPTVIKYSSLKYFPAHTILRKPAIAFGYAFINKIRTKKCINFAWHPWTFLQRVIYDQTTIPLLTANYSWKKLAKFLKKINIDLLRIDFGPYSHIKTELHPEIIDDLLSPIRKFVNIMSEHGIIVAPFDVELLTMITK